MEPDTTIIAGASSWRGTFTQCGGIPRMMAGSMVVAAEQHEGVLALLAQRRGLVSRWSSRTREAQWEEEQTAELSGAH